MDFCREFGCLWFMFILGLLFCCPLATLVYFTYQTIFGRVTFCSLWIDVPGRLTLFLLCYYLASMCGFLPLSRKYRINSFIEPFAVWRLESWSCLFRNLCLSVLIPILRKWQQRKAQPVRNSIEAPLLQENNREIIQRRIRSEPIDITSSRAYVASQNAPEPEIAQKSESPEIIRRSGSVSSLGSSFKGIAVPITKGRSSKPHYLSEQESVSSDDCSRISSVYRKKSTETKETGGAAANPLVPATSYASTSTEDERYENLSLYKMTSDTDAALANYEKDVATEYLEEESIMNEMTKNFFLSEKLNTFSGNNLRFSQAAIRKRKPLPQYRINLLPEYRNIVPEYRNIVPEYRNIVPEYRNLFPQYRNLFPQYRNLFPQYRNLFPQYRNLFPQYRNLFPQYRNLFPQYRNLVSEYRNPPPTYRSPPPLYRKPQSSYEKPSTTFPEAEPMKEAPNIIASELNDDGFACAGYSRQQDGKYFDVTDDEKPVVLGQEEQLKSVHERLQICCTDETAGKEFLQTNDQAVMHEENQQTTQKNASNKDETPPKLDKTESQQSFSRTGARKKQLLTERSTVNSEQETEAQHRGSEASLNSSRIRYRSLRYRIRQPPWASETFRRNVETEIIDENQWLMNQNREDKVKYSEKPLLINSNNGILTVMRKSRSNIKLLEITSFPSKTRAIVAKEKNEQTETGIMTRSDDVRQTNDRCEQRQEMEITNVDNAISDTAKNVVSSQRRLLQSHKFHAKGKKSTRIQIQTEGTVDFKHAMEKTRQRTMSEPSSSTRFEKETEGTIDFKPAMEKTRQRTMSEPSNSSRFENETEGTVVFKLVMGKTRQRAMSEPSNTTKFENETEEKIAIKSEMKNIRQRTMSEPSSSTKFEQDDERVDLLKQITGETDNEGFKTSRLENLKRSLMQIEQISLQQSFKRPAAFQSKQDACSKTEIKITDTSENEDTAEADISTKPTTKDTHSNKDTSETDISTKPTEVVATKKQDD